MNRTLSDIAAGKPPMQSGNEQIIQVQNPNYGSMKTTPAATESTTKINLGSLIQHACGYFEMDVDYSDTTASASVIWGFGGGIVAGVSVQNKALYKYPALEFAVDTAAFKDGYTKNGVTYASAASSNYLNEFVFGYQPLLISDITFLSSGTDASYTSISRTPFSGQSMQVWGNFYQADLPFAPDTCNPCFNADNSAVHWGLEAGISSSTPLTIVVPTGTKGTFRLVTKGYAPTNDFVEC